jgi:hypothetical protein
MGPKITHTHTPNLWSQGMKMLIMIPVIRGDFVLLTDFLNTCVACSQISIWNTNSKSHCRKAELDTRKFGSWFFTWILYCALCIII